MGKYFCLFAKFAGDRAVVKRMSGVLQVVNEASETVYCAADAAARLKQCKNFTANTFQLIYWLDDVSTL